MFGNVIEAGEIVGGKQVFLKWILKPFTANV